MTEAFRVPRLTPRQWLHLMRPGDALVLMAGAALCATAFVAFGHGGAIERAVIRQAGAVVAEYKLGPGMARRSHDVPGPLGITRIELEASRARIVSDPGPRQLCVQQGWLERANAVALCAPNQVSLQLLPAKASYDSLHY